VEATSQEEWDALLKAIGDEMIAAGWTEWEIRQWIAQMTDPYTFGRPSFQRGSA
jgi:hypothetical protein